MFRFSVRPNRADLVAWRPWGEAAFGEAREQDKPVVLFLTAFWCGYCQRLDETSLSSDEVIALLNAFFVPIRVEESQRPDVDLRYNQDGWPTIVFLTPAGDRLCSVNYLAPEQFVNLLVRVIDAYQQDRTALLASAAQSATGVLPQSEPGDVVLLGPETVADIVGMIEGLADVEYGGFGADNKYVHTEANALLLHLFSTTGEAAYLDHVRLTLDRMRQSRTFDAQDGGFFRYSSRRDWQEPHPEKLLDDQAALLGNYLHAFLLTETEAYGETAEGLLDYLNTTLLDTATGMFHGCQDYVRPQPVAGARDPAALLSVIDRYVYCDANARTASAQLDAWWLLGRAECRERARHILAWLWENLRAPGDGMYHYWDGAPQGAGMLMDAVMAGRAFLDAYAVLEDETYLTRSRQLADHILGAHRNPGGGFSDISERGPAALQIPVTLLTQNATLASFFIHLADLSGEGRYREAARWALQAFLDAYRPYGAFAAGYGSALARLLAQPLCLALSGVPGDPALRGLLRAALTRLRPRHPVVSFRAGQPGAAATLTVGLAGRWSGPLTDQDAVRPELLLALSRAPA